MSSDNQWLISMANDWGHWLRKAEAKQGALQGTLGRIRDEGLDGAAIRAHGDRIPVMDFPADIAEFHRAWMRLDRDHKHIIWLDFRIKHLPAPRKWELMNRKKSAYYRLRETALVAIHYQMAIE